MWQLKKHTEFGGSLTKVALLLSHLLFYCGWVIKIRVSLFNTMSLQSSFSGPDVSSDSMWTSKPKCEEFTQRQDLGHPYCIVIFPLAQSRCLEDWEKQKNEN